MHTTLVLPNTGDRWEARATNGAGVRLLPSVHPFMHHQIFPCPEHLTAITALKLFLLVDRHMTFQRLIIIALVSAVWAEFNLSLGVRFEFVFRQLSGALEIGTAGVAML